MEDQSLFSFTTSIQKKHIAHQTTKNKNKNTLLRTNICSLYRINFLEIDLFSSSGYVLMDMTNSA